MSSRAPARIPASSGSPARWGSTGRSPSGSTEMAITDPLTRRVHIKMSGCPNGCSQHHIADIGFYGASIKVGERTIPAYIPHIGGAYEGGEVRYGTRLKSRLPAKRVPDAVQRWLDLYESDRADGETFGAYAQRVGRVPIRGAGEGSDDADRIQSRHHEPLHRLQPRGPVRGGRAAKASARFERHRRNEAAGRHRRAGAGVRGRALSPAADAGLLLSEGGVGPVPHAVGDRAVGARAFTIDTGVLFPETLATWKQFEDRFPLRIDVIDAHSPGAPWTLANCCSAAKVAGLETRALRRRRLDHRDPPRAGDHARRDAEARARRAARDRQAQPVRRLDREGRLDATSSSTICRTTRCTIRAMTRSAVPRARSRATVATGAGRAWTRPSAASTSRDGRELTSRFGCHPVPLPPSAAS